MTEILRVRQGNVGRDCHPARQSKTKSWVPGRWITVGSFAAVAALCFWLGYYTMFNSFGGWDDEGDLLLSLQAFAHHGGLYTNTYSAFGPFYYDVYTTVFRWLPVTIDNGRVVTIAVVLIASIGFGVAVKIFTRSLLAGVATQIGSFILMILSFVDESVHPSTIVWVLFAVALIALALLAQGKRSVGCMIFGATVAALALTEVNVGAFAAIAALFAGIALAPPVRGMRLVRAGGAALFVATPFLIVGVGGHTHESWAVEYSIIVALAAAAVVVMTFDRDLHGLVHRRDAYRFFLGGGILTVVVVIIAILSGTRPVDLVRGMFIDTAHYSNIFTIPLHLPAHLEIWTGACLLGAFLYRRFRSRHSAASLVDGCIHVAVALLILYIAITQGQIDRPINVSFTVALPLLFFTAIPPVGASESQRVARLTVASLAVLEGLVAYPVAGAQIEWSSILMVPAAILCLNDGVGQLRSGFAGTRGDRSRVAVGLLVSGTLLASLGWLASVFVGNLSDEANLYYANTAVTLPASHLVRLPAAQAENLESLTQAIRSQCSSFLALPALNSLYLWTGESLPPNWFNTWFYTSDRPQQSQIVDNIKRQGTSQFCVVYSAQWWAFWTQGHNPPQFPLIRLVEKFERENNHPQLFDGYELFVSNRKAS
jgi:hypothetical protein